MTNRTETAAALPTANEIRASLDSDWNGTVRGFEVKARENIEYGFWGAEKVLDPILVARKPGGLWTRIH